MIMTVNMQLIRKRVGRGYKRMAKWEMYREGYSESGDPWE